MNAGHDILSHRLSKPIDYLNHESEYLGANAAILNTQKVKVQKVTKTMMNEQ